MTIFGKLTSHRPVKPLSHVHGDRPLTLAATGRIEQEAGFPEYLPRPPGENAESRSPGS